MKQLTRLKVGPVALLVLLALLTFLVVKRKDLTTEEAEAGAVRTAVDMGRMSVRDRHAVVAFVVLMALFGFLTWAAMRAHEREDKAMPPGRESSASGSTTFR
jgi:hypothetical protein